MSVITETQRKRRGHEFVTAAMTRTIPDLYETDGVPAAEKVAHAHYYGPAQDWYVVEMDSHGLAFGYTKFAGYESGEWGYIPLAELEQVSVGIAIVERDCYWTPKTMGELGLA
jgi:hypothetical protein